MQGFILSLQCNDHPVATGQDGVRTASKLNNEEAEIFVAWAVAANELDEECDDHSINSAHS